jgi:hypothetical protein
METTKPTDWQEVYNNKQNEINRLKRIFYDADEKLVLPKPSRYYYDWISSQDNSYPMEKKLSDLGFLVSQGFDLKRSIRDYKKEREAYITDAIPQTFLFYIVNMRYGVCLNFTVFILRKLSERKLINLFIDEISIRYNPSNLEVETGGWNDGDVMKAVNAVEGNQSEKEKLVDVISTGKMVKAAMLK